MLHIDLAWAEDDDEGEDDDVDMDVDDDETSSDESLELEISEIPETPNPHSQAEENGLAVSASVSTPAMDEAVVPSPMANGDLQEPVHGPDISLDQALTPMDSEP